MKPIKTIQSLVLLAVLAAGAVSCQKEELPTTGGDTPQGAPLTIHVVDGGYMASDKSSVAQTRATENGYTTEFTAGDKIGLYVVKPDGSYAHQNIALTLTDNGSGTLAWTPPAGTTLYYEGAAAKYYAYYPYQSTLTGTLNPSADAAGFFADVVSAWTPAADQSTYALYTAQDLMVGSGTVSKQADAYTLALTMTHAMALVVIETPMTKYTFTNSSPAIPDYYTPAPDKRFYGFTPCFIDGKYRLLVKPSQSGATDLMGSYTAASGNTKEYAIVQNGIAATSYAHYRVDNAIVIEKSHTLQAGDFYLNDGSLLGKDETPTAEQKAACVGIVYWLGDPTNTTDGDPLLARDKSGCTHGLVVALHDAGNNSFWSSSYEDITENWLKNQTTYGITSLKVENKMQGYANTQALMDYNTKSSNVQNNSNLKVLPIEAITTTYAAAHPTHVSSSGWYFPSVMELKYMCWGQGNSSGTAGRDFLNAQLGKVSGTSLQSYRYWSSTEYDLDWARYVYFDYGYLGYDGGKSYNSYGVRAVLAF